MSLINHINDVIFNDYVSDIPDEISWEIDRVGDIDLFNSLEFNRNEEFDFQFIRANEELTNGNIHFITYNEDFIPFNSDPISIIEINISEFNISDDDINCCVCIETKEKSQICLLNCNHKFCGECISSHIKRKILEPICPLCRTNITHISVQNLEIYQKFI
jgi:hypothetical protein